MYHSINNLNFKTMKKTLAILAAALSIAACNKELNKVADEALPSPESKVPVDIQIMNLATRSETVNPEENINSVSIVVYRVNDDVKTYESFYEFRPEDNGGTIYIDPSKEADSYYIAAYANADGLTPGTYDRDWALFSKESMGNFQMFGYFSDTKNNVIDGGKATIKLYRQCSKVTVEKVSLDWMNAANVHKTFKIRSMFLMDVPGLFANIHTPDFNINDKALWFNANGKDPDNGKDALLYSAANDVTVTETSPYETSHILYGYISGLTKADNAVNWNPTGTSLVIEADFDGKTCYYAVRINRKDETVIRNKHFVFKDITITKPGADKPSGALVEEESISVTLSIEPWDSVTYDNVTIE